MLGTISESPFKMKVFVSTPSSGTLSFSLSFSSFVSISSPSLCSWGCIAWVSWLARVSTFPWSAVPSKAPFRCDSNSKSSNIPFHLFRALSFLLVNSLIWLFIFVKGHVGLSQGDKKATQGHVLLSGLNHNTRSRLSNQWHILKKVTWLVTDQDVHLLFTCGFWTGELLAMFVLYPISHSACIVETEFELLLVLFN